MTERIDLTASPTPGRGRFAAAWVGGWAAYALVSASIVSSQSSVRFADAATETLARLLPLALATIVVWRVSGRPWRSRTAFVMAEVLLGVVVVAVAEACELTLLWFRTSPAIWHFILDKSWMYQIVSGSLEYSTLFGIVLALQARRRQRESEALTREAELAAARARLHPHFILNSLNSIVSLIDSDPSCAREMVVRLSELLQASFRGIDEESITLERELEMAKAYLSIEQFRFGARLGVTIDLDPAARNAAVPPLLLQPIVENAVRHGIAPLAAGGEVHVTAKRRGDRLLLEVRDSGSGAGDDALANGGYGLALTRRRLESTYPSNYTLTFHRSDTGFAVRLDVPWRTMSDD
jgi:sensor histidine kinase YesM